MRIAVAQTDPTLGEVQHNLREISQAIVAAGSDLVVFPECALTGYGFDSREESLAVAQTIPGPATEELTRVCREAGSHAIVGLIEQEGERLYNSAAFVGPAGLIGRYRKMHIPFIGVDRFVDPGDLGFPVFESPVGRIGILICYDLSFPEAARVLKLGGAQLVCVITNWPQAARISCELAPMVRAQENHVHLVAADRVGTEAGFTFRGTSRIIDCEGVIRAEAGTEPETLLAELDLAAADRNRIVNQAGRYELDRLAHRRPEAYGPVVE